MRNLLRRRRSERLAREAEDFEAIRAAKAEPTDLRYLVLRERLRNRGQS